MDNSATSQSPIPSASDTTVPVPDLSALMDTLTETNPETSSLPAQQASLEMPPSTIPPQSKKRKGPSKGIIIAVILFFLISVPIIGFYVNQKSQLADIRNQAAGIYSGSDCSDVGVTTRTCDSGVIWECELNNGLQQWVNVGGCNTTPTGGAGSICSNSSDSTCAGRGYNSACTSGSQSGSCSPSSITDVDNRKICSCIVPSPTGTPANNCTVEGARTCLNNEVAVCTNTTAGSGTPVLRYISTGQSCSISCNNSSVTSCQGKTIASSCGNNNYCQQTSLDANGNPTCACVADSGPTLTPSPTHAIAATVTPTGTAQCQDGNNNRDQQKVLVCNCGNSCTFKTDSTAGGGGSGWVCDQNCHLVDIGSIGTLDHCSQVDYVHQGTSNYCGVQTINCDASCQNTPTNPTTKPTNTPPPGNTPVPTNTPIVGQCTNILVYKDNVQVDPGTLRVGDQVVFGINATPGITTARIRLNGNGLNNESDGWTTITNKVGSEFRSQTYTIPSGITNFTVEGEIEVSPGVWL